MDIDVADIINNLTEDSHIEGSDHQRKYQVEKLKKAWINERMSPELLEFETEVLDKIMVRVREQVEFIEEQSMNIQPGSDLKFILLVVESDLERIKFLIRGYLRVRLSKIDKYTTLISSSQELLTKLSESERNYMQRHYSILQELYKGQFLSNLPSNLQLLDDNSGGISMVEEPDLNRAVFLRVLQKVEHPITAGQDRILLEKGGVYVMRYSAIQRLLVSDIVELV